VPQRTERVAGQAARLWCCLVLPCACRAQQPTVTTRPG